jgi:putative flippase GtrA
LTAAGDHPASSVAPSRFRQWVRHHATAVLSTIVDYGVMVAMVELLHIGPVPATAMGAFAGAVTNFTINRTFTYHAEKVAVRSQVWRYALVSSISLGLNTAGEWLFHNRFGLQYMAARVIASLIVSNGWNYPMLRFFVFSRTEAKDEWPKQASPKQK